MCIKKLDIYIYFFTVDTKCVFGKLFLDKSGYIYISLV